MVKTQTALENFLFSASHSHAKESLINNKLLFDLKLAAAHRGYFLNADLPEVDQDGFDIIFDDHSLVVKTQLKTVMKGAATSSWKIHKRILRPSRDIYEKLGFEPSPYGVGVGGGVILIQIDARNEFFVKYFYTDVIILSGFRNNLLKTTRPPNKSVINKFFKELYTGIGSEKIVLPKSLFLEANSPESLLGLMGLHNNLTTNIWRYHLMNLAEPQAPDNELPASVEKLAEHVNEEIAKLSSRIRKKQ